MVKIFFKTLIKNNILFRTLLTFQLICIFCIYFISCYYWGEYTIGYLIFFGEYTGRNCNLFKIFYKYGAGKKKIILCYYIFELMFFLLAYLGTVVGILLISRGWFISISQVIKFVIYELPVFWGIYSLAFGLVISVFGAVEIKEKKSDTFFKNITGKRKI